MGRDTLNRKWCYPCQCFHEPKDWNPKECAKKEDPWEKKTGMIKDMLDYN